jgi:cell division septation protein DedD
MGLMPPLGSRDGRALLVFFGGVIILFAFYAVGAYVGRWPRGAPSAPPSVAADAPRSGERYFVEAAVFDNADMAEAKVEQLRRKYTSAHAKLDARDRLYHVYIGSYRLDEANAVAAELREMGLQSVVVKPANSER